MPGTESLDLPKGSLRGRPEIPDDSATVVAVTYRLAAPFRMLNVQAGAIARAILTAKGSLVAAFPNAAHIEAPDTDKNTAVLPVHPGVVQYLSSGEQSFLDEMQGYFYAATMLFSVLGSVWAMAASRMRGRRDEAERKQIGHLIQIADEARAAPDQDLGRLEGEFTRRSPASSRPAPAMRPQRWPPPTRSPCCPPESRGRTWNVADRPRLGLRDLAHRRRPPPRLWAGSGLSLYSLDSPLLALSRTTEPSSRD